MLQRLALGFSLLFSALHSLAQVCQEDYFVTKYQTSTVQTIGKALYTSRNEIVFAGSVVREGSHAALDGWFTKLSPQGTILISKIYSSVFYTTIRFNKVIPADGDNYFLVGNIGNVDTTKIPPPIYTQYGFLVKVDKHGNIIWSKMFGKTFVTNLATDINNIVPTGTGDYILTLDYNNNNSAAIIVRIDKDGNIKWTTTLSSPTYGVGYGPMSITQSRKGDLLLCFSMYMFDRYTFGNMKYGYYLASLDSAAGIRNWERTFIYADTLSSTKSVDNVVNLTELPNGDISFIASYADNASIYFRKTSKMINFIADNVGRPKKTFSYHIRNPTLYASAVSEIGHEGDRVVLCDNADASFLIKLDADGSIKWQHGYAKTGRSQETRTVMSTSQGNYFFSFTHNGGPTDLTLVKTDSSGNADCVQTPVDFVKEDASAVFKEYPFTHTVDQAPGQWYGVIAVGAGDYKMTGNVECKKTCCTEAINTAIEMEICNADSYTLPDGYVATVPGKYQISYKTRQGCDSIVYFNIKFPQKPQFDLGQDDCLDGKDSIMLSAPPGYDYYNWNGSIGNENKIVVRHPGKFILQAGNKCGISSDTIEIFEHCEFEVYVPSAFSPNHDQHNDVFKLPSANKNRLIRLSIFNRWGQMIFTTTDIKKGWDGTLHNLPQPTGIYVYSLEMETLNGKRITKKGTVTLIR